MPTFRQVNTGQVVQVDGDPSHLSGLARWERIEDGEPSAPALAVNEAVAVAVAHQAVVDAHAALASTSGDAAQAAALSVAAAQVAAVEAQEILAAARDAATAELADLNDALAEPDPLPAADAPRAEWVAYAKSQGKTDADLKGKKVDTIRDWYITD